MSRLCSNHHEQVDRPENIWANSENFHEHWTRFHEWWQSYYRRAHEFEPGKRSVDLFKLILGSQTTTVTFRHRNWVWVNIEEGWTLYVSKRGPAFHVNCTMTPQEAADAFAKFTARVDAFFTDTHG